MDDNERLARIELVTRRYGDLQGLGRCCLGLGLIIGGGVSTWMPPGDLEWFVPMLVALPVCVFGKILSDRYYKARFGRVSQLPIESNRPFLVIFSVCGVLTGVQNLAGPGYPNAMFLIFAIFALRALIQDWPLRKYLILDVSAAAIASALYIDVAPGDPKVDYYWMGFTLLGAAALITGKFDHHLLVRTLSVTDGREESQHAESF